MPLQNIIPANYSTQLAEKVTQFTAAFAEFFDAEPDVACSEPLHYRLRAEFHVMHYGNRMEYAMFGPDNPKQPVTVEAFPVVAEAIYKVMPRLRELLHASNTLRDRLFQVDFLSTMSGQLMITLIYRQPIGPRWEAAAQTLAAELNAQIIGRSRGRKLVVERDWLLEEFELNGRQLRYQQIEASFTQPNGGVNRKMLAWACHQASGLGGDLLELYCGNGNFTVALAPLFKRVLATEVSKSSVRAAEYNLAANGLENVAVVRLSSEEISAAIARTKSFIQLKNFDLGQYRFSTLFVDPPRSGLDAQTLEFARSFDHIIYISCNQQTLLENVIALQATHEIAATAVFDQFPYTPHLECGLLLTRRA